MKDERIALLAMGLYVMEATLLAASRIALFLFFASRLIPRWLSIWGLIAAPVALVGTMLVLFGSTVPIVVFLPNLPFGLTIGVWLLVKGTRDSVPGRANAHRRV